MIDISVVNILHFTVSTSTKPTTTALPSSAMSASTVPPIVEVRLRGGSHDAEGRVEVYYSNTWNTICSDGFDRNDGNVICKQLGYG